MKCLLERSREVFMKTYIVLLRGINVSGKNILPMQDLRDLLSKLKFENVQTYIQSGNIILNSSDTKKQVSKKIKEGVSVKFGYVVPVLVRTIPEWENAIAKNPYPKDDTKLLSFTFLNAVPEITTFEVNGANDDEFVIIDDVLYIYCLGGFGKTKLTLNLFERKLKVIGTSRNWRTTMKLLEMAKA